MTPSARTRVERGLERRAVIDLMDALKRSIRGEQVERRGSDRRTADQRQGPAERRVRRPADISNRSTALDGTWRDGPLDRRVSSSAPSASCWYPWQHFEGCQCAYTMTGGPQAPSVLQGAGEAVALSLREVDLIIGALYEASDYWKRASERYGFENLRPRAIDAHQLAERLDDGETAILIVACTSFTEGGR